ncbi:hypothetical protein [Sansalvadorimonas verongulae]|uniref:hypothetical protein n=1 Tax=Sansalvadorimonas verongulae TaxID=2172824 RepID=UPI0012BC76F9|nr:hypothetical protein [Sansalvadorimonas verongulae]MTI13884.1 hypothetical protein [Sansalvadorimonas verongulae]
MPVSESNNSTPRRRDTLHSSETAALSSQTPPPPDTPAIPVEATKYLPEQEGSNNHEPSSPSPIPEKARELLNQTSSGRAVTLQTTGQETSVVKESEVTSTSLNQRTVREEPPKGWLDTLLPWRWTGSKTTQERKVTKPERSGIKNWTIFFVLKKIIEKFVTGLSTSDLAGALQTLSAAYHRSKNGTTEELKPIYLKQLHLPGPDITLQDVCITPRRVTPTGSGEGADRFTQIDIAADISGKAVVWVDDGKSRQANLNIKNVDICAHFKKGAMLEKLLEKGTLYGNLTYALWNYDQMKDCLLPTRCTCHLNEGATVEVQTPGYREGASGLNIHSADLELDFAPSISKQGKTTTFATRVKNLDAEVHSSRMDLIVPDSIRPLMRQLFPHAMMGTTSVQVQAGVIDTYQHDDGTLRADCRNVTLNSKGDVGLRDAHIPTLTLVKGSEEPSSTSPDTIETTLAVHCPSVKGDIDIPQSSFNLPYDIKGQIDLKNSTVLLTSCQQEGSPKTLDTVDFSVECGTANLHGGISCTNAMAREVTGTYVAESAEMAVRINETTADSFAIGTAPDRITPENLLFTSGIKRLKKAELHTKPDPATGTTLATVSVDELEATHVEGVTSASNARFDNLNVTFQAGTPAPPYSGEAPDSGTVHPKLTVESRNLTIKDASLPEGITGQGIQAKVSSREIKNLTLECTMPYTLTDQKDQQAFKESMTREVAPWQIPQIRVASVSTKLTTDGIAGDIDVAVPGDQALRSTGALSTGHAEMAIEYDMRTGLDKATLESKAKTVINMQHGDLKGKVVSVGFEAQITGGTEDDPDEITTHTKLDHLRCTGLSVSEHLLPKGVKLEADMEIVAPSLQVKTRSPECLVDTITGETSHSSRPIQSIMEIQKSEWKTRLEADRKTLSSPAIAERLKTLANYLPERYQAPTRPLLEQLATIPEELSAETPQTGVIKQGVTFRSGKTTLKGEQKANSDKTFNLATSDSALELPSGAVSGTAHLKDMEVNASSSSEHTNLQLDVGEVAVAGAETKDNYQLPVQLKVHDGNRLQGIKVAINQNGDGVSTHGAIRQGNIDLDVGANGVIKDQTTSTQRKAKPTKIKAKVKRVEVNLQQDKHMMMANSTVAQASLNITQTQDQLGTDLDASTRMHDALVVADSTGTGTYMDAELGHLSFNISGDLNGTVQAHQTGISACRDMEGIKINPRIDSRRVKTSFPQASRELVNIFSSSTLQKSALGQICDLKVTPDLNENVTGTLTISAGGALSPVIALALSRIGGRFASVARPVATVLSRILRFHIYLDHLPVQEGKATLPDLLLCLKVTFSSDYGRGGQVYAKAVRKAFSIAQKFLVGSLLKRVHMLDRTSGEISLANLASYMGEQVQFVSKDHMPEVFLPGTGDALNDTRHILQLNGTLPENWTEEIYRQTLKQRIQAMRWGNHPLESQSGIDIPELARLFISEVPLPKTITEFRAVEDMLDTMQDILWKDAPLPTPKKLIKNTLESTPAQPSPFM